MFGASFMASVIFRLGCANLYRFLFRYHTLRMHQVSDAQSTNGALSTPRGLTINRRQLH